VIVDDFGWIDRTLTGQQRWVISNSIAGWALEGVAYGAYLANGQVESVAKDDPALKAVASAVDLDGSTGNWMVFTRRGYADYLVESAKLAVDLGASWVLLDNASPDLGVLSFDDESVAGFREHLAIAFTGEELEAMGVTEVEAFDYRAHLLAAGYVDMASLQANPPGDGLWGAWLEHNRLLERRFFSEWTTAVREHGRDQHHREVYLGANRYVAARQWDNLDLLDVGIAETFLDTLGYPDRHLIHVCKTARNFGTRFWSWNFPANTTSLNGNGSVWDPPRITESDKIFAAETLAAGGLVQDPTGWVGFHSQPGVVHPLRAFYQFPSRQPGLFNQVEDGQFAILYSESGEVVDESATTGAFRGAVKLLVDLHWPFDVLFAAHPERRDGVDLLSLSGLERYDAVWLPNTRGLTDEQVALLEAYVNGGGTVIGFGQVADRDAQGGEVAGERVFDDYFADQAVKLVGAGKIVPFPENYAAEYDQVAADEESKALLRAAVLSGLDGQVSSEVVLSHNEPADAFEADLPYVFINRLRAEDGSVLLHLVNRRITIPAEDPANQSITPLAGARMSVELPTGFTAEGVEVSFVDAEAPVPQVLEFTEAGGRLEFDLPTLSVWGVIKIGSAAAPPVEYDATPHSEIDLIGGHPNQSDPGTGGHRPDEQDGEGRIRFNYWYWKGGNHGSVPWSIPFFATDDGGLRQVELFYRHRAKGADWSEWKSAGSQEVSGTAVYGEFLFEGAEGEGYYEFYTQATDGAGGVEPVWPWGETAYGVDRTPAGAPSEVVANQGIRSGYWTNDLTGLEFVWTAASDALSGLGNTQVSLVDEIGSHHLTENVGTNSVWSPDTSGLEPQKYQVRFVSEDLAGVWNGGHELFDLLYGNLPVADVVEPAVAVGDGQLTVYWELPEDPSYLGAMVHYRRVGDPEAGWEETGMTPESTSLHLTVIGLENDEDYQVRVVARAAGNQHGNYVLLPGVYTPSGTNANAIRLRVDHPTAGVLSYWFDPVSTVGQLKQLIESGSGTLVEHQELRYRGVEMADEELLGGYGVGFDATLELTVVEVGPGPMDILVNQAGQPPLPLSLYATNTVQDLKHRIQSERGVPVEDQTVFKGLLELVDSQGTLGFYGVEANDQLMLEVRPAGPSFQSWQQLHFPEGGVGVGSDDDWDGDGLRNIVEYAFGTDAKSGDGAERLPRVWRHTDGRLRLGYSRVRGATDLQWGLERRSSLGEPWLPVDPADFITLGVEDGADGTEQITLEYQPSLMGHAYFRVILLRGI